MKAILLSAQNNAKAVVKFVADGYGVPQEDILGNSRDFRIAFARHMAMYLTRELSGEPLSNIGRYFKRNHSSVIHAVQRIQKLRAHNPAIARDIDSMLANIKKTYNV